MTSVRHTNTTVSIVFLVILQQNVSIFGAWFIVIFNNLSIGNVFQTSVPRTPACSALSAPMKRGPTLTRVRARLTSSTSKCSMERTVRIVPARTCAADSVTTVCRTTALMDRDACVRPDKHHVRPNTFPSNLTFSLFLFDVTSLTTMQGANVSCFWTDQLHKRSDKRNQKHQRLLRP